LARSAASASSRSASEAKALIAFSVLAPLGLQLRIALDRRRRIGRRRIGGGGPLTQVSLRVALATSMRPVKVAFEVAR
jgi:hypothetical protein